MDNIKLAIQNLHDSISAENRRGKDVENSLMQLHSTANLLKLSSIPPNTFKRISELLRQRLLPLYQVSLTRALQYSTAVLEFIQDEKLIPTLKAKNEPLKQLWERLLTSLVSGVLDYLDQSPDSQSRELIASVFYPILTRIYFSPLAMFLSEINGGLLSAVYQLLVTTVEPQARNAARLRDHGISSKMLGLTLSQIRDFLAIESLLDIICTLIPPVKNGVEKRSQFIKEVFDPDLFQCSKSILHILESITDGDWSITAVKVIEALAGSDISFPQPFNASSLMICGISVNATAPFYVDKNGFLANLDQDGKLETLHVPFHTVTRIVGSSTSNIEFSIVLVLSMPPIIGTEPLSIPSGRGLSVSWNLKKSEVGKFTNVAKNRNLTFLNLTTRKLSLPGTHIAFNLSTDKELQESVSTRSKIHDMTKLLAMPSSPEFDHTEPNSPINRQSESRERKAINITPSAEPVTEIAEDNAAHQSVLDHNGNLSFTDPHPVNKAFIQSFGDNTLLAVSSTSEVPRHLVQRSTKNQEDSKAITSRVTHSDNIAPQTISKPPNGNPKRKRAPPKNSPAVKRRPNQTTILDSQLHSQILSQGHSAVPIDVDNLLELKETIPPSKTQKRHSATAGTMDRVTKLLDEPRREDRSLETNISPVDLKSENKKRAIRIIEDSEGIHVAEQERPNKRTRMDHEKPLHSALSYQRKKYGRNGKTSSPRGESPISTVNFDEIPDASHTGVVKRLNSRASVMNGKRSGKKTEPNPAAPKKRKREPQDVKLLVKPTAPKVPVSLVKTKRDKQVKVKESLFSDIDHHLVEQETTTGPEMKLDCHSTSLGMAPSITQIVTEGYNEHNVRKIAQMAPWEDKNVLQKVEGTLEPIPSPSTKEILAQSKGEIWDPDHSLTLVVDDDDYEQEKEVEPSTFEPEIDMIDLEAQNDPIVPINLFSKSSLKENKPVANVQLALHEKQTQKVTVEISSPHHLPTRERHNRPSVSFALPVEPRRYPWPETSTFARKQRKYLASRTMHQQRYHKAEEKKYEEPQEPIERIAEIIKQIGETVVHQISRRFDSVRDELHAGHRSILQGTLQHLERMHEESTAHLADMIELEEEYALRCGNILKGFDALRENSKNLAFCVKNIVKEHNQQSLSRKFPPKLFDKRTWILLNATIGSNPLD